MAVVINGSTGIATPDGSAGVPPYTGTSGSTNGVYFPSATTAAIATNGVQAIVIDASQNVTNNAATTFKGNLTCNTPSTTTALYQYWNNGSVNVAGIGGYSDSSTSGHLEFYTLTSGSTMTEWARIPSTGGLQLNGSTSGSSTIVLAATAGSYTWTLTNTGVNVNVGFLEVPQNSQTAAYTAVLSDSGKHIYHPSTDNNARTFTIPANGSVPFPVGTVLTFVNMVNTVTISINTDTMYLAGSGSTTSRTLAAYGILQQPLR